MSEIRTPPIINYDENGDEIVSFTAAHSWSDVVRWIAQNRADAEEVYNLLGYHLENPGNRDFYPTTRDVH